MLDCKSLHIKVARSPLVFFTFSTVFFLACSDSGKIKAFPESFGGVGLELKMEGSGDIVEVVGVIPEGPADVSGLRLGDIVVQIDDVSLDGMTLADVVSKLRGPSGTQVVLAVKRPNDNKKYIFVLKRSSLQRRGSNEYKIKKQ